MSKRFEWKLFTYFGTTVWRDYGRLSQQRQEVCKWECTEKDSIIINKSDIGFQFSYTAVFLGIFRLLFLYPDRNRRWKMKISYLKVENWMFSIEQSCNPNEISQTQVRIKQKVERIENRISSKQEVLKQNT